MSHGQELYCDEAAYRTLREIFDVERHKPEVKPPVKVLGFTLVTNGAHITFEGNRPMEALMALTQTDWAKGRDYTIEGSVTVVKGEQ